MAAIIYEGYKDIAQIKNKPTLSNTEVFRSSSVKKNIEVCCT